MFTARSRAANATWRPRPSTRAPPLAPTRLAALAHERAKVSIRLSFKNFERSLVCDMVLKSRLFLVGFVLVGGGSTYCGIFFFLHLFFFHILYSTLPFLSSLSPSLFPVSFFFLHLFSFHCVLDEWFVKGKILFCLVHVLWLYTSWFSTWSIKHLLLVSITHLLTWRNTAKYRYCLWMPPNLHPGMIT